MSNFSVQVVKIDKLGKHPNADSLSITQVFGQNVIFRTEQFSVGDLAVYVPYDAVVDLARPEFSFLDKKGKGGTYRIKPVRLRGIYSEGVLIKPSIDMQEGQEASESLGVTKYVEPEDFSMRTDNESDPQYMPVYSVESYFKYPVLKSGEDVVVTEKIHGCNSRFLYKDDRLWVGSHGCIKKKDGNSLWWKIALKYDLENRLKACPNMAFFGETYGAVQDLKYGVPPEEGFRFKVFDIFDTVARKFLDYDDRVAMVNSVGLENVPELYRGPFTEEVLALRSGMSTLDANTIREGVILRPTKETFNMEVGRVVLKAVSEEYKMRNSGTEHK